MKEELSHTLRAWYEEHKRDLEWRHTRDPYRIWLSETILQQTRVQQGAAYYHRFVEAFPTVADLAAASEDQVLKLWQGLGYYSRARNLHKAARRVVEHFEGHFPDHYEALRSLPGVGDYTASAVGSIAANRPLATVDGNVYRLYARLFDIESPIDTTAGARQFKALAEELLDRDHPGDYNQALMEFGALHCTPTSPACEACPLEHRCQARANGTVALRPQKQGRTRIRDRYLNYLYLTTPTHTLIHRREGRDIWRGLYEFPLIETPQAVAFEELPLDELLGSRSYTLKQECHMPPHQLSHQRLHARFYHLMVEELPAIEGCSAIRHEALGEYAVSRLTERYLNEKGE